jgi:Spy/CpxP family protein refolding chaperone
MNARTLTLTLTAAALIAVPGLASAQAGPGNCDGTGPHGPHMMGGPGGPSGPGGPGGPGGDGGHGLLRFIQRVGDRIGLSDAQQAQIQAILDAEMPAVRDLMEQARTAAEDFRASHDPGDFSEPEYRAFFESQARIHVEARLLGAAAADQVWDVLTPEQQQQVLDLLELMGPGHGPGKRSGGKRLGQR